MSAGTAVRIALLNNPAGRRRWPAPASTFQTPRDIHPAKLKTRQDLTLLPAQAHKAWIVAVAAATLLQVQETAQAAGDLSRRMTQVGNLSKLQQAKDHLMLSKATLPPAKAQQAAFNAREQLIALLGLWGEQTRFSLPAKLPALPPQAQDMPDVESRAGRERVELRLAQDQWQRQRASKPRPASADALWDAMGDAAGGGALALSASSAIEAQRDFWLAEADLQTLLAGAH